MMPLQVDWETASGAVNMVLIHQLIANAYQNVSNVVLAITPKSVPPGAKAVLLNAHFDNTLSSPGMPVCARLVQQLNRGEGDPLGCSFCS
jgi:hypothetical protein